MPLECKLFLRPRGSLGEGLAQECPPTRTVPDQVSSSRWALPSLMGCRGGCFEVAHASPSRPGLHSRDCVVCAAAALTSLLACPENLRHLLPGIPAAGLSSVVTSVLCEGSPAPRHQPCLPRALPGPLIGRRWSEAQSGWRGRSNAALSSLQLTSGTPVWPLSRTAFGWVASPGHCGLH